MKWLYDLYQRWRVVRDIKKRAGFGYCGRSSNGNRYCSFHSDVSRRVVADKPAKLSPKHLVRVPGYLR